MTIVVAKMIVLTPNIKNEANKMILIAILDEALTSRLTCPQVRKVHFLHRGVELFAKDWTWRGRRGLEWPVRSN